MNDDMDTVDLRVDAAMSLLAERDEALEDYHAAWLDCDWARVTAESALFSVEYELERLDEGDDLEGLRRVLQNIAVALNKPVPFLEDVSDLESESWDIQAAVDDALYELNILSDRLGALSGSMADYVDGCGERDDCRDGFETELMDIADRAREYGLCW